MKYLSTFIIIISLVSLSWSQINVSGSITSNTTWDDTENNYIITGNVTVNSGVTLTVAENVTVEFQADRSMIVYGTLNATEATFTSNSGSPAPGDWHYIQVGSHSYSGSATFEKCEISYGGGNTSYPANLYLYSGTCSISNSDISQSGYYGIYTRGGMTITINNTNIYNCYYPITYTGPADISYTGANNLTGNTSDAIYIYFTSLATTMELEYVEIPYYFYNTFTVKPAGNLSIASGNIIKFNQYRGLYIEGILNAVADVDENIYFTSIRDDNLGGDTNVNGAANFPVAQDWVGITFRDASNDASCVMRRCLVSFAGYHNRAAIRIESASPTITECEMTNSYYGAGIRGVSNPVFSYNKIGSSQLVPIAISFDANPQFLNNEFSTSDNEYDAIGLFGGTLGASAILPIRSVTRSDTSITNITYLMLGTLTVPEGLQLTINKGIVIKGFASNHRIIVKGKFAANATADSMITMTSAKDDKYGNPLDTNRDGTVSAPAIGNWGGIIFESSSDPSSVLNYCRIKYAEMPNVYYNTRNIYDGAVTLENASPTISNCEITDVKYGIYIFQSSNPTIQNNQILNSQYTPIALSVNADPVFSGNNFTNTSWKALGIINEKIGINGTIKRRTVAGYNNITYVLLGDLTINSGTEVTVESGVVIKMNTHTSIIVEGGFRAQGDESHGNIIFTSLKDDNFGNPLDTNTDGNSTAPSDGDWRTIRFQSTSDDVFCLLDLCTLLFGGNNNYGAVTFTDAGCTVSNSILTDSYSYGVRCEGTSAPNVQNVQINNSRLDPIAISLKSNPTFSGITFAANGSNGIRILEGTLSSDATLDQRDVAGIENIGYIVHDLTISSGAKLTITPGVVIKFNQYNNKIIVNGALDAQGTKAERIVFTSLADDSDGGDTNNDGNSSSPTWGDWWSIAFNESGIADESILFNCVFRYGGRDQSGYSNLRDFGAIRIFDETIPVDSCTIEQSHTSAIGIYGSASPVITDNDMLNIRLAPIYMSMFSSPVFSGNFVSNLGQFALGIVPERYSNDASVPQRNFAGITNITYYVPYECTINSGTTITIPAGTVFKYYNYNLFNVEGKIVVNGTAADPVVITNQYDDDYGNPMDTNTDGSATSPSIAGSAYAFRFQDISNDESVINHTIMRYVRGAVHLQQASPTLRDCFVRNSTWGFILNGVSNPVIENNNFHDLSRAPISISLAAYPQSASGNTISGSTYRAIGIIGETLAQDATLQSRTFAGVENIPYYLSENYTVGSSVTLTIDPGVILKFTENRYLTVRKGFHALGGATPDSLIVFTDIRDDFYGGDTNADSNATTPIYHNSWNGIQFADESLDPLCIIKYAIFRYAGGSSNNGAIKTTNSSPSIEYCVFTKNQIGLIAYGASDPTINYSDIYDNVQYGVRNVDESFDIDATNNWWGSNTGPTHASNPTGTGDVVTDAVNFIPYYSSGAVNPIMGDVSLNGIVQAFDASLILKSVVGSYVLGKAQERVANVSGESGITAMDASLVLQYIVGLISNFPAESAGMLPKITSLMARVQDPQAVLLIGSAKAGLGEQIKVPIKLEQVSNVLSLQFTLEYDPSEMQFVESASGKLSESMHQISENDPETGVLKMAYAGTEFLETDGVIAYLNFETNKELKGTVESSINVTGFLANEVNFTDVAQTGIIQIIGTPLSFQLNQNYPNPFNGVTKIEYQIPDNQVFVSIAVYDLLGRHVKTLVNKEQEAGIYKLTWDGTNSSYNPVASGIYFYKMQAGNYQMIKKLHYLK